MKLLTIHHRNVHISYKNSLCSFATIFWASTTFFAVVLPIYLIMLLNQKSSLTNTLIWEQPQVQYNYQYDFVGFSEDPETVFSCSSFPYQRELFGKSEECGIIKFFEEDLNDDGVIDEMEFSIDLSNKNIKQFTLHLFFQSDLKKFCNFVNIPTVFLLQIENLSSLNGKIYYSELELNQQVDFNCPLLWRHQETHFRSLNLTSRNAEDYLTKNVFKKVSRNPGYFRFQHKETFNNFKDNSLVFHFKIPEVMIRFQTPIFQTVQQMWIRFLSLFIVLIIIINKLKDIAFSRYWVRAWEVVPWKKTL